MKHETFSITYYHSNFIPIMLFGSEEDAEKFDTLLAEFINNPRGKEEWNESCKKYPSAYVIAYNIEADNFDLIGDLATKLICEGCEKMIAGYDGLQDDDCYRPVLKYIWNKFEPKICEAAFTSVTGGIYQENHPFLISFKSSSF